jgi:hypothetical protein
LVAGTGEELEKPSVDKLQVFFARIKLTFSIGMETNEVADGRCALPFFHLRRLVGVYRD